MFVLTLFYWELSRPYNPANKGLGRLTDQLISQQQQYRLQQSGLLILQNTRVLQWTGLVAISWSFEPDWCTNLLATNNTTIIFNFIHCGCSVSCVFCFLVSFLLPPTTERMAEEDWKGGVITHRKRRDRLFKTLKGQQQDLLGLQRSEGFHALTYSNIRDRITDYHKLHGRIEKHIEGLEDEEDEDTMDQDDLFRRELKIMHDEGSRHLNYMAALKKVASLLATLEVRVADFERMQAADPERDYSACYSSLDKLIEETQFSIQEGNIALDHTLAQQTRLLSTKMLEMKTTTKPESKSAIVDTTASRHIDAPKVNLPDFQGDLLSWPPFWSRYNASVHESTKLP